MCSPGGAWGSQGGRGYPGLSEAVLSGPGEGWGFRGCGDDGGSGVPVTVGCFRAPRTSPAPTSTCWSSPRRARAGRAPLPGCACCRVCTSGGDRGGGMGAWPRGRPRPPRAIANKAAASAQLRVRLGGWGRACALLSGLRGGSARYRDVGAGPRRGQARHQPRRRGRAGGCSQRYWPPPCPRYRPQERGAGGGGERRGR